MMGALISGPYTHGPSFIKNLNSTFDIIGKTIEANAAAGKGSSITWGEVTKIFEDRYPAMKSFFALLNLGYEYAKALGLILTNSVIPAFKNAAYVLVPLYLVLKIVADLFLLTGHHGTVLAWVLTILIANWLIYRQILVIVAVYNAIAAATTWALATAEMVAAVWSLRLSISEWKVFNASIAMGRAQKALVIVTMLLNTVMAWAAETAAVMATAYVLAGGGIAGVTAATYALIGAIWTLLASVPIVGWIALLIIGFGLLYWKVKWFRDMVNDTAQWIWKHWVLVSIVFAATIGPVLLLAKAIQFLANNYRTLVRWASEAAKWIGGTFGKVIHAPGRALHAIGLQEGGYISRPGAFWVGERGPELVTLPVGASVIPATAGQAVKPSPAAGLHLPDINLKSVLVVDGKQLAESVSRHRLDAAARA
jgi:hypothetical protein